MENLSAQWNQSSWIIKFGNSMKNRGISQFIFSRSICIMILLNYGMIFLHYNLYSFLNNIVLICCLCIFISGITSIISYTAYYSSLKEGARYIKNPAFKQSFRDERRSLLLYIPIAIFAFFALITFLNPPRYLNFEYYGEYIQSYYKWVIFWVCLTAITYLISYVLTIISRFKLSQWADQLLQLKRVQNLYDEVLEDFCNGLSCVKWGYCIRMIPMRIVSFISLIIPIGWIKAGKAAIKIGADCRITMNETNIHLHMPNVDQYSDIDQFNAGQFLQNTNFASISENIASSQNAVSMITEMHENPRYCPTCGCKNEHKDAKFCSYCGNRYYF